MEKKRNILIGCLAIVTVGLFFIASNTKTTCANYDRDHKEDCYISPVPTQDIVSPSPSISVQPSQEVSDTPIPSDAVSETPTPTLMVTSTPPANNNNSGPSQSNVAQSPVCATPFQAPVLQGFQLNGNGSVTFSWWPTPNATKYSIIYGYGPQSLIYGEDNIPGSSTAITINDLQPGNHVWAIVYGWQGQCAEASNELDPLVK